MWRLISILLVFALLQNINGEIQGQKSQYAYKGKILAKNIASDNLTSIWTISGILSVEKLDSHITFKLDDVKTRIYNGDPSNLNKIQEKQIPETKTIIQEPFTIYTRDKNAYNITHRPDEPIWSLNMKRSIANIFYLNTDIQTTSILNETTIYGDCQVKYKIANDANTIWKIIDNNNCENSPVFDEGNVEAAPTAKDFDVIKAKTKRIYYFENLENLENFAKTDNLKKIEAISTIVYQSMPSVKSKQIIEQNQEFNKISSKQDFDPIDISALTKTSSIIFDNSEDETNMILRELKDYNSNQLINYFKYSYNRFKGNFNEIPLNNDFVGLMDTSRMYYAMQLMDEETLLRLQKKVFHSDDVFFSNFFVSYFPYLGTNASLHFIKDLIKKDDVIKDLYVMRILALMPTYINDISEELVEEMEDLINLHTVENNQVRFAAYLCFANIVSKANSKNVLSYKKLEKYVATYAQKLQDAEDYETQMVMLLGLVNMANGLTSESIFDFIMNSDYSRHFRVLAAYGFKEHIIYESATEVYGNLWPLVKNHSEPFEVRVACLDIILYTKITEEQFKNIVNWYKDELHEPSEQHLANYMYTSLKALQNTTGYYEYLGDLATEALATIKPLKIGKAWSTGNYRMAYTDSDANFGASFQARLISNPISHVINSAFFTVDSFAHSLNLGRYSLYVKGEGIAEKIYSLFDIYDDPDVAVPKLLELIQKNSYILKQTNNVHIDLVLFLNNQVVFSMHISKYNVDNYATNPLFAELLSLLNGHNAISYPVFDYNHLVSDLGTRIDFSTDIIEISAYEAKGFHELAKSSSSEEDDTLDLSVKYQTLSYYELSANSYNPLLDTSIATFKIIEDQNYLKIPFVFNVTSKLFVWKHDPDNLNLIGDHVLGTYVEDEDILKEYCKECSGYEIINTDEWTTHLMRKTLFWQVTGVHFNITYTKPQDLVALMTDDPDTGSLLDIMEHHQSITFDTVAKPFLIAHHYLNYKKYVMNDLFRYSIRSVPFYNEEPTETLVSLYFNNYDNTNEDNPIAKEDINSTISIMTRKQNDAEILGFGNVTFRYFSDSETNSTEIQPHIHHNYDFEMIMYSESENPIKLCINRDVQYPSRRTNKFSLDPIDNATAVTTFFIGEMPNNRSDYAELYKFYVKEIYSASDKQKTQMISSPEYKNCKEQSRNLDYIPPTDDCLKSHDIISKYQICDIYADSIPSENSHKLTEHGVYLMQYAQTNETHSKLTFIDEDLPEKLTDNAQVLRKILSDHLPIITTNPRVIAYDDDDVEWGIFSTCYITPNRVRTFTGHTLKKYYDKSGDESVAFLECLNATTKGMTIQKYGDKYVGFKFYALNDTITVSVPNQDGKLKIQLNDEIITKTNRNSTSEYFEFYFLDDNVVYISLPFISIFYTGEYISLEVITIYNNYICGLCSETQHF